MKRDKYLGIITRDVVTVTESTTSKEVAILMRDNDIGVVVVLEEGKVAGVVSERDITRRIVAEGQNSETALAKDFMTRDVLAVDLKKGLIRIIVVRCGKL